MSDSEYFAPVSDDDTANIRNDALVDAMLEFSLSGNCSNDLMARLAEYFLFGRFIIPMMRSAVTVGSGTERFEMARITLEGLTSMSLCTDASSLTRLTQFDAVSLIDGQEAARIAIAQSYDGLTLVSDRMDNHFTFTLEMLEGILSLLD